MPKKSNAIPDWFDLSKYEAVPQFSEADWLLELTTRASSFEILQKRKLDPTLPRDKSHAFALNAWQSIQQQGIVSHLKFNWAKIVEEKRLNPRAASIVREWLHPTVEASPENVAIKPMSGSHHRMLTGFLPRRAGLMLTGLSVDQLMATTDFGPHLSHLRHVVVDLDSPDDVLTAEFRRWLEAERLARPKRRGVTKSDMRRWSDFCYLPFLDLNFYALYEGRRLTNNTIGLAIFPNLFECTPAERVRESVRRNALALLDWGFLRAFELQLQSSGLIPSDRED